MKKKKQLSSEQALVEARKRFSHRAMIRHNIKENVFSVGQLHDGFEYIYGEGCSWADALEEADNYIKAGGYKTKRPEQ